jgi:hypothetical protein
MRTLRQMALRERASFKRFCFLERSGEQEITLSGGPWPAALHAAWIAEAERLGWRVIDHTTTD